MVTICCISTSRTVNPTAVYTNIPAGTHAFHIRACNSDGVWDRAGIVYNVTQPPFFYETNLFRLTALGMAILLAAVRVPAPRTAARSRHDRPVQ